MCLFIPWWRVPRWGFYGRRLIFVSERTNKRQHHHPRTIRYDLSNRYCLKKQRRTSPRPPDPTKSPRAFAVSHHQYTIQLGGRRRVLKTGESPGESLSVKVPEYRTAVQKARGSTVHAALEGGNPYRIAQYILMAIPRLFYCSHKRISGDGFLGLNLG
jgi:hypothetical protein